MAGKATSAQRTRVRELVAADLAARLELGDLLLQVAPWPEENGRDAGDGADDDLNQFAAEAGLSAAQAHRYRKIARAIHDYRKELAHTGVSVTYAAISAAVLRSGGSTELLLDVCRQAAAEGRTHISASDVEQARRAVVRAQAEERRLARANERTEQARREQGERHAALMPYRDGIAALVATRVDEGADPDTAETEVVRDLAERVGADGGNPADLLQLGSEIVDRRADVVKAVRKRAGEVNAVTRRLANTETLLRRLADDTTLDRGSEEAVERWLTTLDRIITHSVDLVERLKDSSRAAQ